MRLFATVVGLAALAPLGANAQEVVPTLDSIGPGCCRIRVRAASGSAEGRFQARPAPGRVVLTPCKGNLCPPAGSTQASVAIPPGAKIDMYAGRAAGQGAIIGAAVGAVLLTVSWLDNPDLDMSAGGKIAAGIPVGALAGSAVGALIGAFFPRWKPVRP